MANRVPTIDGTGALTGATRRWVEDLIDAVGPHLETVTADQLLNNISRSFHGQVLSGAVATAVGAPVAFGGLLTVEPWGNRIRQVYATSSSTWERWSGSTGWMPWRRVDHQDAVIPEIPPREARVGVKTLPVSLTLGTGGNIKFPTTGSARYPLHLNAPVRRWRLHIENINPRYQLTVTGEVTLTDVWVGNDLGNGVMGAPVKAATVPAIDKAGFATVTPWVSTVDLSKRPVLVSLGWTGDIEPVSLVGGCWTTTAPGDSATAYPDGMVRSQSAPFHVWLEVETDGATPVLAAFGDSLTCGVGATLPVHDSWLSQYCRREGAIPMHYAASGDSMDHWRTYPDHYKWTQWEHLDRPDALVWCMGSNDVFATQANLADLQDDHAELSEMLAERVSPVQYAATIMPRTSTTGALEDVRRSYNAWLRTQPNLIRDVFDFGASISTDDETIIESEDADGIHLTTRGYTLNSLAVTRPVTPPVLATTAAVAAAQPPSTGWRALPLLEGVTGTLLYRRTGDQVWLRISKLIPPPGQYAVHVASLPASLAPDGEWFFMAHDVGAGSPPSIYGLYSGTNLSWYRTVTNTATRPTTPQSGSIIYATRAAMPDPSAYPGALV